MSAANVREESNGRLRHGEDSLFSCNPNGPMHRNAAATPHYFIKERHSAAY